MASGLGVLLAASEVAFQAVKWVGAAYLAWLGWKMLRSDAAFVMPADDTGARHASGFAGLAQLHGGADQPKALLFMSAFLPQFINPAAPLFAQYATLAAVLALMNVATMLAYATLGAQLVRAFRGAGLRWMNRVCGSLMMGLAATLALYRRGAQ